MNEADFLIELRSIVNEIVLILKNSPPKKISTTNENHDAFEDLEQIMNSESSREVDKNDPNFVTLLKDLQTPLNH